MADRDVARVACRPFRHPCVVGGVAAATEVRAAISVAVARIEIAGIEVEHEAPPSTRVRLSGKSPGAPHVRSAAARESLRGVGVEEIRLVLATTLEGGRQAEPAKEIEHLEAVHVLDQDAPIFGRHEADEGSVGTVEPVEQLTN